MNPIHRWTDDEKAKASTLWRTGQSAAKIAEQLKVSRSAVLGMANRHRDLFPARGRAGSNRARPAEPVRAAESATVTIRKPQSVGMSTHFGQLFVAGDAEWAKRANDDFSFVIQAPTFKGVRFVTRTEKQCPWFIDDEGYGDDRLVCGGEVSHGSYCWQHAKLVYEPGHEIRLKGRGAWG